MSAAIVTTPEYVIGDTWDLTATILDERGGPFDLTGCTVLFTLKRKSDTAANDNAALCKLSTGSGIVVADPTSGVAAITVPASVTAQLSTNRYKYDVRVVNAGGEPKTVVLVEFSPTLGVTERTS